MGYKAYPEYKESGVEWLGKVPIGWEVRRLKFIASHNDEALSENTDAQYELEYVDISSVDLVQGITSTESMTFEKAPSRARRIVKHGDTLVSTVRTYLKAIATINNPPENLIASTGFAVIRAGDDLDARFLAYYLQSQGFVDAVVANSTGVSYPAINASDLVCIPATYPPLRKEQEKIANILDHKTTQIDGLIEKKQELIAKLQERRIALITNTVTKGLRKPIPMRASGIDWLGDIPKHWDIRKLRFILNKNFTNGLFKKAESWGQGTKIINVFNLYIHNDVIKEDDLDSVNCSQEEEAQYSAIHGDFFLVRSSLKLEGIGKSATIINPQEKLVFECHLIRGRPDLDIVDARFLNLFLNSKYARDYFISRANSVTMATIDQTKFKDLFITLPNKAEQIEIVQTIDAQLNRLDSMVDKNKKAIARLQEYRTALITAAVTGQIDVRDWQAPEPFEPSAQDKDVA